ncbi:hypothetical protein E2C01_010049 [Portunus trituberculatus]|uniref:Uncharacterized protein n=1 Tax=Portunus trituberculatus TaxID=210409 RepID=A0A5B7D7C1_PORTR|nr:hypothetical protein [Portunus trituberculatus]
MDKTTKMNTSNNLHFLIRAQKRHINQYITTITMRATTQHNSTAGQRRKALAEIHQGKHSHITPRHSQPSIPNTRKRTEVNTARILPASTAVYSSPPPPNSNLVHHHTDSPITTCPPTHTPT